MSDPEQVDCELSCRQLLLHFYSSEINTHGRVLIGFAALMFTILTVRVSLFNHSPLATWQLFIFYGFVFAVALTMFYLLFRLVGYGILANATIHAPRVQELKQKNSSLVYPLVYDIKEFVVRNDNKILFLFPIEYFFVFGNTSKQRYGFLISFGFSIISAFLVYLLLEV